MANLNKEKQLALYALLKEGKVAEAEALMKTAMETAGRKSSIFEVIKLPEGMDTSFAVNGNGIYKVEGDIISFAPFTKKNDKGDDTILRCYFHNESKKVDATIEKITEQETEEARTE